MLADYLPLRELQSALPEEQFHALAAVLRRAKKSTVLDPASDKRFLAQVYEAYYGPRFLARKTERYRLLQFVPEKVLAALASKLGVHAAKSHAELVNALSDIEWTSNEQTRIFLEHFGYPSDYLPEPAPLAADAQVVAPPAVPLKPLRAYQADVSFRSLELLHAPCSRFMIQMPTGSGKTRTAMEIVCSFLAEQPSRRIVWIAHSEELCEQAVESFLDVWTHVGRFPITLMRCWGSHTPLLDTGDAAFVVAGFSKLNSLMKRRAAPPRADLVVVDEAHMVLAPVFTAVVGWVKTHSARLIGLSATPGRGTGGDEESRDLAAFFNNEILEISADDQGVIQKLQGMGILARIEREALHTHTTFTLTKEEWQHLSDELEYPPELLRRMAADAERNRIIIEKLWAMAAESLQTLVFATSVEQSKLICAALLYNKISAAHIDGSTPKELRRAAITKFRRGDLRFLSNYQVLSTGFDAPRIDAVVIARPTKSMVLYSQMVGRGLRGPAVGGTALVRLVDVVDNIVDYRGGVEVVYERFAEYWS